MRLICPNCEAQYEVPAEVIPEGGRDVQCSNCGDTWFQHHPDHVPAEVATHEIDNNDGSAQESRVVDEGKASEEVEPDAERHEEEHPEAEGDSAVEDDLAVAGDLAAEDDLTSESSDLPKRQELEPSVTDILREEATLEQQTRFAEVDNRIETQPDLGINQDSGEINKRSAQVRERMARLKGPADTDAEQVNEIESLQSGSRRDLLPNIEEITSSLSSATNDEMNSADANAESASGELRPAGGKFSKGFLYAVLFMGLAAVIYIFAPALEATIPALKSPLGHYTDMIDAMRSALDKRTVGLQEWLQQMSSVPPEG